MALTKIEMERFTAFSRLKLNVSPGINVLVGANGTGKTHILKVGYAACDVAKTGTSFVEKLIRVFLHSNRALGRLVKRQNMSTTGVIRIFRDDTSLSASFTNHAKAPAAATTRGVARWANQSTECVYIPVKEMLSNAPGFLSLYEAREIHFEEVYADILHRAYRPILRGPVDALRKRLLAKLQRVIDGKVTIKSEEFFLRNRQGNLELSLLAEGMRKLALLWLLIQNGTLRKGSILFWDEPETNLNPKLFGTLIDVLLELQRVGVQIFIATHDYVILKEIDLRKKKTDRVAFHALYREEETGAIACHTSDDYLGIHPNAIAEAFTDLYDREIERSPKGAAR